MKIIVTAKSVYGETKLYPANDAARHVAAAIGTKTLTRDALANLRLAGAEIIIDGDATLAAMFQPIALGSA